MPKVSIIVPVYNSEKFLKKCIESMINQTYKDIEIIIIDDGSKDNSREIIQEYQNKDSRIKYLYQKNSGQAVARNNGIKVSIGEFISFLDSDDYIDTEMIEKLYNKAIKENTDIVVCDALKVYDDRPSEILKGLKFEISDIKKKYIISSAGPWGKLIKKNTITENNLFFKENIIYEDFAVVPAYALFAKKISYIEEPLYLYYQRVGSTMNQESYNKKFEDIFVAYDNLTNIFKDAKQYDDYIEEFKYLYLEHLLRGASFRFLKYDKYDMLDKVIKYNTFSNIFGCKYLKLYTSKEIKLMKLLYSKKYKTIRLMYLLKKMLYRK